MLREWAGGERCGQTHLLSLGNFSPQPQQEGEAGAIVPWEMSNWGWIQLFPRAKWVLEAFHIYPQGIWQK